MIKCFLSHSSQDKESYVRLVASRLRKEVRIFDEETFEKGLSPLEEIANGLDESSLFVIFLSNAALNSKWVQDELKGAKHRFDAAKLDRIYPIIIEQGIDHDDPRIPEWMRFDLNIQPIFKPTIAARKINARLMEISWKFHPRLKEREQIFVGRNELINQLEERLDDFSRVSPIALIASGLPSIGRKSLLQQALRKSNITRDSFEFPVISLAAMDGIEDFIVKTLDLGLAITSDVAEILAGDFDGKVNLAKNIFRQIATENERLLIEDRGVLIQSNGDIVDWFTEIINDLAETDHLTFCVASRFRANQSLNRTNPLIFSIPVNELDVAERNGLLLRYSKFHSLNLKREEYEFFSDLLTGYPEQVLFAVDLINEHGVFDAKKQSHAIQQYGSDKAKVVLEAFQSEPTTLNFIYFLCRFEFLSYDVLFDIVDEANYGQILASLLSASVCEQLGSSSAYIRVNEVIRDYVSRNRFDLPNEFEVSIKNHVGAFLSRYEADDLDISDYLFSAQESLRNGNGIPDEIIIPSVFIKTIKRIYDEDRNYDDVITLANRVLLKQQFLHANTVDHIRYIKCQALARLRDGQFFSEVKKVPEPDRSFLHGFYYRLSGEHVKAQESLARILDKEKKRRDPRVISELVLIHMQGDEYDLAFDYARESYRNRSGNAINANNYFACLIMKEHTPENKIELERIISNLAIDSSDRSQEMLASMKARMSAYYDQDEETSLKIIDETINRFPQIAYPMLTKADLADYFGNKKKLREAVDALEKITRRNAQSYRTFIRYKAILIAMEGDVHQAKQLVKRELSGLTPNALKRLYEKLDMSGK